MNPKILISFFAFVSVFIVFNKREYDTNMFSTDKFGYLAYLPGTFIYNDLDHLAFYEVLDSSYGHTFNKTPFWHEVNGKRLDKYSIGVAIMEAPCFLIAHAFCKITRISPADGFSIPYKLAGIFSNIIAVVSGLLLLASFLNNYFSRLTTCVTIGLIAFGTNLYAYTAFETGMSHPYCFLLLCGLLWVSRNMYSKSTHYHIILFGVLSGLLFDTRPIDTIAVLVPLLWGVDSARTLRDRLLWWLGPSKRVLFFILPYTIATLPQLAYWHYITGHWFYYTYTGEGFDFLHPNIMKGLFSYRKGWFLYTPMALVGTLGIFLVWVKNRGIAFPLTVFFTFFVYMVFCWREWWYGGSFGCRPLIGSLAFLSIPLAFLTDHFLHSRKLIRTTFFALCSFLILLNIFQTYQYSMGLIHWDRMTEAYYWKVFGDQNSDQAKYDRYLLPIEDENKVPDQ